LPLIGLLGWLVVTMWQWGSADLRLRWAREQMDGWTTTPAPEAWRAVRDVLAEARDKQPGDPDAHEQLGRLYAVRAEGRDGPVAQAMLRQARDSYEQALRLRPASPYTWAGLARVTHRLGDDAAFVMALERADELGPWEFEVQMTVLRFGLQRWDISNTAERERTAAAGRRALVQSPRDLVAYARRVGMLERVCELLERPDQLGRNCPVRNPR